MAEKRYCDICIDTCGTLSIIRKGKCPVCGCPTNSREGEMQHEAIAKLKRGIESRKSSERHLRKDIEYITSIIQENREYIKEAEMSLRKLEEK